MTARRSSRPSRTSDGDGYASRGGRSSSSRQRRVVRVRWTVVPLRRSVVRGAFPPSADNGTSYAYDGPLSPYDVPSYAAHFHRPRTTARRTRTMGRRPLTMLRRTRRISTVRRTTARRTRTMDRCPLTMFRRTRHISTVRGQRHVVSVLRSIVSGAFLSSPDDDAPCAFRGGPRRSHEDLNPGEARLEPQVILVGSWEAGQRHVIAFAFPGSMSVVSDSAKRTVIRCGRPSFRAAGRGQANPWRPSPRPVAASSGRNRSAGTVSR